MRAAALASMRMGCRMMSPPPTTWASAVVSAVLAACLSTGSPALSHATPPPMSLTTSLGALQAQERTIETLFDEAIPSVVYITTFAERTDRLTLNAVDVPAGTGSGFVWDSDGHIATNVCPPPILKRTSPAKRTFSHASHKHSTSCSCTCSSQYHVIRGAQSAKVVITGRDGRMSRLDASLVGYNPDRDVAVLKVDTKQTGPLTPIKLGESALLRVGQYVLAIGNPFGLDRARMDACRAARPCACARRRSLTIGACDRLMHGRKRTGTQTRSQRVWSLDWVVRCSRRRGGRLRM